MEDNYDDDPLGFLAEFKKGRYMSFSIDSSNLYLNEIPEGECSDGKSAPPPPPTHTTNYRIIRFVLTLYCRLILLQC